MRCDNTTMLQAPDPGQSRAHTSDPSFKARRKAREFDFLFFRGSDKARELRSSGTENCEAVLVVLVAYSTAYNS